jgi:hypothetical protein
MSKVKEKKERRNEPGGQKEKRKDGENGRKDIKNKERE